MWQCGLPLSITQDLQRNVVREWKMYLGKLNGNYKPCIVAEGSRKTEIIPSTFAKEEKGPSMTAI